MTRRRILLRKPWSTVRFGCCMRSAFKHAHLVWLFDPQLPWFRGLEGHPGYAEVLAERQRRIDKARAQMRAIEAQYPDSVIVKTLASVQQP